MMKCIDTLESDYSKCKNKRRCRDELQKMEKEHMIFFLFFFWPVTVLFLNLGVVTISQSCHATCRCGPADWELGELWNL